jgi:hypothetical protein
MAYREKMGAEMSVGLGQDEICRILDLKEHLQQSEVLEDYISRYLRLGWSLTAVDAAQGTDLGLDFSQPQALWEPRLEKLGLEGIQINLAVRTGKPSGLMVLEVNQGEGALALEQLGDWQAAAVATVGNSWEQHYYALPQDGPYPPSFFQAPQVLIYGEGGLVLVPPALEPQAHEPWRWLEPPWKKPLHYPPEAVWQFLRLHIPPDKMGPEVLPWSEVYRRVSPYGALLQALLVPPVSQDDYYEGILTTALGLGLQDPPLLLGLLWHAPHGDSRHRPERWEYLQDLAARALEKGGAGTGPVPELPAALGPSRDKSALPPQTLASHLALASLGLEAGGSEPNGFPPDRETPGNGFNQTVSGQFFQLLAGLGEKVISESCRYEAILSGLGGKAAELENLVQEWERNFSSPTSAEPSEGSANKSGVGPIEFEWASLINLRSQHQLHLREVQTAAHDFLARNPDLAADSERIRLVIFFLRNYISINPEWAGLPFREKLERAGNMARAFLKERDGA